MVAGGEMKKHDRVDGWVVAIPPLPSGWVGVIVNATIKGTFQFEKGGKRYTPCFSTLDKLQRFCNALHAWGIDMKRYDALYAEGLEDKGDVIWNPDAQELLRHQIHDIRDGRW